MLPYVVAQNFFIFLFCLVFIFDFMDLGERQNYASYVNSTLSSYFSQGLSLQHKPLCSLADQVPQGYKKRPLIEVLIRNNVPLLKATWFIKVTYLNQVQ